MTSPTHGSNTGLAHPCPEATVTMTGTATAQIFQGFLQLSELQRAGLLRAIQDAPDVQASLQYLPSAHSDLEAAARWESLIFWYAQRWQLAIPDTRAILESLEKEGRVTSSQEFVSWATPQRLQVLLQGGWTYAGIAQALTEGGLTVGRGVIKQLSRGRHLYKANPTLLMALQGLPDQWANGPVPESSSTW